MKKSICFVAFVAIIALLSGCAKDGATGPQGPQGPTGTNGLNGVANITTSTFTANPGTWNTITANAYFDFSVSDPDIIDANSDLVAVFIQLTSGGDWVAIPASSLLYVGDAMGFSYNTGTVTVSYQNTNHPTVTLSYKFIVIPPAMKKPNVDYNNYAAVKSVYNLKD